jgi:uncharacterized Zn-binding protein involved in type VI secretion
MNPSSHVGGPIVGPGAPNILIGGFPAARVSDFATCPGAPDVLAMGAATVLIAGLPAARQVDGTAHGGLVVLGCPTVLIGGATYSARPVTPVQVGDDVLLRYGKSLYVRPAPGDSSYQASVVAALVRLDTTKNMRAAIDALEATQNHVTIRQYVPPNGWGKYNAYCQPYDAAAAQSAGGSSSAVAWDPNIHGFGPPGTPPNYEQPGSDVILAHELIHGVHNAEGKQPDAPVNSDQINVGEERNTVGLPAQTYDRTGDPLNGTQLQDTSGSAYTENGVRADYAESGVPSPVTGQSPEPRPSYYSQGKPF